MDRLYYDPFTGDFTARMTTGRFLKGRVVGTLDDSGYLRIRINSKAYYAHKLAWFYVTGEDLGDTDLLHEDGVLHNNAWNNLKPRR